MEITIQDAIIPKQNPTDTYCVHVKSMHGDADAYTTQTRNIELNSEVIKLMKFLTTVWTMTGNAHNDNEVRKAIKEAAEELDLRGHGEDIWMEMVEFDQTNEQSYAEVDEIWVTYFNKNGIEHHVLIHLDEPLNPCKTLNRYRYREYLKNEN